MNEANQYARQRRLVPADRLAACGTITVIGVGAVGRQIALQLAQMGAPELTLIDPDTVERINLPTQGWISADVGFRKVDAMRMAIRSTARGCQVNTHARRCEPLDDLTERGPIFCCIDTISDRADIWREGGNRAAVWIDGRTGGEAIRVYAASDQPDTREHYAGSLFPQAEQYAGTCGQDSTGYAALVAAGMMLTQFVRWLRRQDHEAEISLSLLASELHVIDAQTPSPAGA